MYAATAREKVQRQSINLGFCCSPSIMATPAAAGSGLFKFLRPSARPQSTDIQAAVLWGVAAGTTALWLIQPFDWLKKTFFEKPDTEQN